MGPEKVVRKSEDLSPVEPLITHDAYPARTET
jgi:hypothetical protein